MLKSLWIRDNIFALGFEQIDQLTFIDSFESLSADRIVRQ